MTVIYVLVGIALIYFIADVFVNDKFKPYVNLVIGIITVIVIINPIAAFLDIDITFKYNFTSPEESDSYRESIENIFQSESASSIKNEVKNLIENLYQGIDYDVRIHKISDQYRIYVTIQGDIGINTAAEIKNFISDKTGISPDYVNIYLS